MRNGNKFFFVRSGELDRSRYGIKGTVECKLIEPLGVEYCMSYLRSQGVETEFYDFNISENNAQMIENIVAKEPICIGFSILYSHMFDSSLEIIRKLRQKGYKGHITAGGTYPTLSAEFILKNFHEFNSVVCVEGEIVSYNLLCALLDGKSLSTVKGLTYRRKDGEIVENEPNPLLVDLDQIPDPARDHFDKYTSMGGIIQIHSSRGCHANCKFCGTAAFYRKSPGKKWRARSPKHVADEIENLLRQSCTDEVWLTDDNFIGPGDIGNKRAIEIADEMISRNVSAKLIIQTRADNIHLDTIRSLKRAGLRKLYIGVEGGTKRHLDTYGKRVTPEQNAASLKLVESEGIFLELGFIGFDPYTTMDEFAENISFLDSLCYESRFIHPFSFDILIPYRGTPIWRQLISDGLARENGVEYVSIFKDKKVVCSRDHVIYLLNILGPATERIKQFIIDNDSFEKASNLIHAKNKVFITSLWLIHNKVEFSSDVGNIDLRTKLNDLVLELNNSFDLREIFPKNFGVQNLC